MSEDSALSEARAIRDQANSLAETLHRQAADETAGAAERFRAHVARDLCREAAQKLEEASEMLEQGINPQP